MELSKYIKLVKENSQAREIQLELKLNSNCEVDDNGNHKLKIKLIKKE